MTKDAFLEFVPITIQSGQSVAEPLDLRGQSVCGIYMPDGWDAANLTFQASRDDSTWQDVYRVDGTSEYSLTVAANRYIPVDMPTMWGIRFLRLRSGTSGTPVVQTADRTLYVARKPF